MRNIDWTKVTAENLIIKANIVQGFTAGISGTVFA